MIKGLDMNELLEKAKELQQNLADKKKEAASKTVETAVGGGMVQTVMNGNLELLSIKLDPAIVDQDDIETLEDLIRAAVNESLRQAKGLGTSDLTDIMSGMQLPKFNAE